MSNKELEYILSRGEYTFVPGEAATEFDEFVAIGNPPSTFAKSFRCSVCGGVYTRRQGIYNKGRWYCLVLECAGDIIE